MILSPSGEAFRDGWMAKRAEREWVLKWDRPKA
jgi:hypothetical protein